MIRSWRERKKRERDERTPSIRGTAKGRGTAPRQPLKADQVRIIDHFLQEALRELNAIPIDRVDPETRAAVHEAQGQIMNAGCALDPRLLDEDASGMSALNQYLVGRALSE